MLGGRVIVDRFIVDEHRNDDGEKLEYGSARPGRTEGNDSKNDTGDDAQSQFALHQEPTASVGCDRPPNRRSRPA